MSDVLLCPPDQVLAFAQLAERIRQERKWSRRELYQKLRTPHRFIRSPESFSPSQRWMDAACSKLGISKDQLRTVGMLRPPQELRYWVEEYKVHRAARSPRYVEAMLMVATLMVSRLLRAGYKPQLSVQTDRSLAVAPVTIVVMGLSGTPCVLTFMESPLLEVEIQGFGSPEARWQGIFPVDSKIYDIIDKCVFGAAKRPTPTSEPPPPPA